MAQPLPVEILLGIYLGILTGMFPALVAWALGFIVRYVTGVTVPAFAVVVLAMALAGISGGLLALTDATVLESGYRIVVALVVVMMLGLYAHAKGDAMGAEMPRRLSLRTLRDRTLSADVVDLVGARGEVRVEVVGDVVDMEGYPPLPDDVRREITAGDWRLPADLPISELEVRFADRLRTELDLADVSVTIDERGRATVVAAPPLSGLSKRVPAGKRAVSVEALVPTGMARGDEVVVVADGHQIEGTVVSARSGPRTDDRGQGAAGGPGGAGGPPSRSPTGAGAAGGAGGSPRTDGGAGAGGDDQSPYPAAPQTTTGGEGRVTVAVSRADAKHLLSVQRGRVVVTARGTRREFELLSLLRRAGKRFRKVAVRAGGALDGATIGRADIRERHGVAVLAVKQPAGWTVAPHGSTALSAGDELFVVGRHDALEGFEEVAG